MLPDLPLIVALGKVGLLAGNGVLSRTMISELCDKTNRIQGESDDCPYDAAGLIKALRFRAFHSFPDCGHDHCVSNPSPVMIR